MRGQVGTWENLKHFNKSNYDKEITYEENLSNVMKSRALLDICIEGQEGLTVRPMEALYLKRKLITNNKSIKDTLFYNKNNVFIIGEDSWDAFDSFMKGAWEEQSSSVLEYYTGKEWIKRFGIRIE